MAKEADANQKPVDATVESDAADAKGGPSSGRNEMETAVHRQDGTSQTPAKQ